MQPVRWGILGTGRHFLSRIYLPLKKSTLIDLCAIASRDEDRAKKLAGELDIPRGYGSYNALLNDPDVEAVFISIPNHLHLEWISKAAAAGKHILCEKPLTLTAQEAKQAVDTCRAHSVLLMEAFMYKFHPQWVRIRELVSTGAIGAVRSVHGFFGYMNTDPANIRNIAGYGGGGLYDIGCYPVSVSRFIFGREPDSVMALVNRDTTYATDVLTSGILAFGDAHATFTVSTQCHAHQSIDIIGTVGRIRADLPFNPFDDVSAGIVVETKIGSRRIDFKPVDQYALEFEAFSAVLRNGGPSPIAPQDAVGNMAVIDGLFRSERSGTWERI